MFFNNHSAVSSVTSPFRLDKFNFASNAIEKISHVVSPWIANKKRADASIPNFKVRELLECARQGGMSQKDFELTAGRLRPNTSSRSTHGFNGRLWHHYVSADASMSCDTFSEYAQEFRVRGWIDDEQVRVFMIEALAVRMLAKLGRPTTPLELETGLAIAWLNGTIKKLVPDMPNRVCGAVMRNITKLPLADQAAAAKEVTHQLIMLYEYGRALEKREDQKVKFGTNLSH